MPAYKLHGEYEALLCRLSKDLSIQAKKRVSKTEVLTRILDVVLEEERLFSTKEQPISFFRRNIFNQPTKAEEKDSETILAAVTGKTRIT